MALFEQANNMEPNHSEFLHVGARSRTFDLAVLRTLVLGSDLGSFARAAQATFRSPSAVSAQIKNLERDLGMALTRKSGRGVALTPAGQILMGYARRLLDLNDQAIKEMESAADQPEICIGVIEDLTAMVLPLVLAKLQKKSPPPHVQVRIGRHHELAKELELGKLDLVFGWEDSEMNATSYSLPHHPLVWIGSPMFQPTHWTPHNPMPLVFLTGNCPLRIQGTRALTAAGIPWKVACTSSSLDGVWAAVREGIGVTVRSALGLPPDLQVLRSLPVLPSISVSIHCAAGPAESLGAELMEILGSVAA